MTPLATLPLAAPSLPDEPTLGELAEFALTGLTVVFFVLALLLAFSAALGLVFRALAARRSDTPAPAAAEPGVSGQELAVIAAAVAVAVGKRHRVVHVRGLTAEDYEWGLEGRFLHHTSHNPARRGR